ncbi:MAG TPA: T9SS type A sorting domain-containing protein, partial [Phaeodactylibacter sp.]|nr:T9SS type A sorting domain-containing protein [Phaeodactylibacter sp.]
TQNTPTNFFVDTCYGGRLVHIALMGDPTLRMHIMEPVASVNATDDHTGNVLISWEASGDAELGYHIYKREPFSAVYSRLTQEPTTDLTYVDECVAPDRTYTYMVRALRLEHSASGSYYNLSQGITDTAYVALSCMSAVEEPERATIEVSPVPADEWLRVAVQFPQEGLAYQIQLTDTKGQLLKELSGKGNGTIHLDITSLASGLYWLRLRDELGKEYTRSVVVSK